MRASTQKPLLFFRGDAKTFLHTARAKKEAPKNIVLDFSGVRFVSRSFADELLLRFDVRNVLDHSNIDARGFPLPGRGFYFSVTKKFL